MQSVVHFEMPYDDSKRASQFYSQAFGWDAQAMGTDYGDYVVTVTTEVDPKTHRPIKPGAINGGLYKRMPNDHGPRVVIAVDDIQDAMKKVKAAGGKVMGGSKGPNEPDDIPNVGLYVGVEDTEGNYIGLLQPSPSM
jgi:predicted enzyme related to lactoylglutathione lyase